MRNSDFGRYQAAKNSLRVLVERVVKNQNMTQKEIIQESNAIIDTAANATKSTPRYVGVQLREYFNGLFDAAIRPATFFAYDVEGQLYRTGNNKTVDLPVWDQLPREMWPNLGDCGGMYWRDSMRPFFIGHSV